MSEINYDIHMRENYADPSPYPEIKVLSPNLYYAEILMDDYAGVISEFTAISQYSYHNFEFKAINKELSELLENVSITEMMHLEILANTINKLGGNPIVRGSYSTHGNYWNGSFIHYGSNLCERIKADIDSEYNAIEEYQKHIYFIADPNVQLILQRIILDEKVHIRLFNQALLKYCGYEYRPL